MGQKPGLATGALKAPLKFFFECRQMKTGDIGVGDERIGGGREGLEHGADDVGNEMEASMDRLLAKDGYFLDVCLRHGRRRGGGENSMGTKPVILFRL